MTITYMGSNMNFYKRFTTYKHPRAEFIMAYIEGQPVWHRSTKDLAGVWKPVKSISVFDWDEVEFSVKAPTTELYGEVCLNNAGEPKFMRDVFNPNFKMTFSKEGKLIDIKLVPETVYD